jgi:hypothetical protein
LVATAGTLGASVLVATVAIDDRAPILVTAELPAVAAALEDGIVPTPSLVALDACFAAVRERRGTVDYGTEELSRLLTVMRLAHNVSSTLDRQHLT